MTHHNSPPSRVLCISVPQLHPELVGVVLPVAVRCFDPGIADPKNEAFLRPEELPLSADQVRSMQTQFAQLARESRSVGDLAGLQDGMYEDAYSRTSFAIRDEMTALADGSRDAKLLHSVRIKAQTLLCLAWTLEESAMELDGLTEKLTGQWKNFEQSLGLDEDASDEEELLTAKPYRFDQDAKSIPKPLVIDAMLTLLPTSCGLFTVDEQLKALWEEFGVVFSPASPDALVSLGLDLSEGALFTASAPGFLLTLSRRCPADKPWLAAERTVIFRTV